MKQIYEKTVLAVVGIFGAAFVIWCAVALFSGCKNKPVPPVVPPVVDSMAIALADSISRNWFCSSIKAPDEAARAISVLGKAWPVGSVLTYKFIGGSATARSYPIQAFKDISAVANLTFREVTTGNADCRISFDPSQGAFSYIGTDCKYVQQSSVTTNLGWTGLDVATHEILHFCSAGHEQSSPRSSICWDKPVVYAALGSSPNFWPPSVVDANVFFQYAANQVDATEFDPVSVMEYQIPPSWTCNKVGIPGGKTMTEKDKFMLRKIYPGVVTPPAPPTGTGVTLTNAQAAALYAKSQAASNAAQTSALAAQAAKNAADSTMVALKKAFGF